MSSGVSKKLQFVPFSSTVSPGFWYQLVEKKLNVFKLDDSAQKISGFYTNTDSSGIPCQHNIEYDSFEIENSPPPLCFNTHGCIHNKNTIEEFKNVDKKHLLGIEAEALWDDIETGRAIKDPSLLSRFFLLTFADLKKYNFWFWFGFPTFLHSTDHLQIEKSSPLHQRLSGDEITKLTDAIMKFEGYKGFFLLSVCLDLNEFECHHLKDFNSILAQHREIWFVFSDPSTLVGHAGWPLRNCLLLVTMHWAEELKGCIKVVCLRQLNIDGIRTISRSLWLELSYDPNISEGMFSKKLDAIGWERNRNNKLAPRNVNLADNMDPKKLAESAVDLNLKLMRWRLMPSINLEKIAKSKCLLLGSGTLGCNVARALLGWGVKKITLLDYGKVSFSNPVRQTLFEFSDCSTAGGRPKALAAAERLMKIFPGVDATGVDLSIPMPGHPVDVNEVTLNKAKEDVAILTELIDCHDVVFLLMDSRESRWLPTVLSCSKRKLVINAALGFDSYLVMRHGIDNPLMNEAGDAQKLGCYFCNDVVAPGNSIRDRTLDQQCTVSRPGVSMIAAAIAVELFVSVSQHEEEGFYIPPAVNDEEHHDNKGDFPLGRIPHQIRGYLSHYQTLLPTTHSFSKCTACSEIVLNKYDTDKMEFLLKVFNSPPKYLEDITGLTQLHQETALAENEIIELSDDESI